MRPAQQDPMTVGYDALRRSVAAHRIDRAALRVSGPDAVSYLQGQCSQDVAALSNGEAADGLLLSPRGKIDALVRITRTDDDGFVIDTDGGFGEAVRARLERFRLRVKVTIDVLAWKCVAVRGPDADESTVVTEAASGDSGVLRLPESWPGFSGFDLLGPIRAATPDGESRTWVAQRVVRCGHAAFEAARIEAGCPRNGQEITEATIAAEVGLVDRTVSFTKGCFTGQELVARLDSRGSNVARRLAGLVVSGAGDARAGEAPPVGAAVWAADGEHEVGSLTSVAWSPHFGAPVALTVLHRRVVPPETVVVRWGSGGTGHDVIAEARPLPLLG
ncbi:MAG: CAF17-like 4Fe-4S cluster assembly/insertion protein YgfZ [Acidimicrobiales bacterium]